MEGLDSGQTSNPSLAWKSGRFQINDDDDDDDDEKYKSVFVKCILCNYGLIL